MGILVTNKKIKFESLALETRCTGEEKKRKKRFKLLLEKRSTAKADML